MIRKIMEDSNVTLTRAYWETYRGDTGRVESVCSLYIKGSPPKSAMQTVIIRLQSMLAMPGSLTMERLYVDGALSFEEYAFALIAGEFVHNFIFKGLDADREIMNFLERPDLQEAMAHRILEANRNEYTRNIILAAIRLHPELIKSLYRLFDLRFNPERARHISSRRLAREIALFNRQLKIRFIDDATSLDIFSFMTHMLTAVLKTNFYLAAKRSFSFRLNSDVLDPLVFPLQIHGIFFVAGFYSVGIHMRAEDIARGGLRLSRVTPDNYEMLVDQMLPLNYALGPVAQRLKHKDIAESGSKGVIVPGVVYARDSLRAVFDYTDGILDLVQPSPQVVDHLGRQEVIFFGPDEGTAPFMDTVAERARQRGYKLWRTLTTGKSIGIPHDAHGLTRDGNVFTLMSHDKKGTELLINGVSQVVTKNMAVLRKKIGGNITTSGMTTAGVMASFRALIDHLGMDEKSTNLMITGGPDGDLGANQIQSFKGKICLIIDGGGVLFDPNGLNKNVLLELALARHTSPRLNSMDFPDAKLGQDGFKVPGIAAEFVLPDGTRVDDGALFHRTFLTSPETSALISKANIEAFIPCGGFRETINAGNVRVFMKLFKELRVIVEGANVFFDDTARRIIATETGILQIKDSTANKGGVTCSSIGEVLPALLLGNAYEKTLLEDSETMVKLIRDVFGIIEHNATAETKMLLALRDKYGIPLYELSVRTSEQMLALQKMLMQNAGALRQQGKVTQAALKTYIPATLRDCIGMDKIVRMLKRPEFMSYYDAIITKQLSAMALYRHGVHWEDFLGKMDADWKQTINKLIEPFVKP